jgi:tetratricopeptide (TPR) repeat protein/predicted aspartyl protease
MSDRHIRGFALLGLTLSVLTLTLSAPVRAADKCKLGRLAVLPVTMDGLRPTVEAQINGRPALFTLDSGAFWSMITPASAQQYQLPVDYSRLPGMYVQGVGGRTDAAVTTVKTLTVFNLPIRNMDFIVGGGEPGRGTVGLLGQNILRIADIEYDLAQATVTLFKPEDCKHTSLDYWIKPGDADSVVDTEEITPLEPHTIGKVILNGAKVRVVFDTGAPGSMVSLRAAAAAGLKPGDPGVQPVGYSWGIGRKTVETWVANFPVLKIGEEEIKNARLYIADLGSFDMLLGDDFFLSHRIYVSNSQHKLYFTYNGGPVFSQRKLVAVAAPQGLSAPQQVPQALQSPAPGETGAGGAQNSASGDGPTGAGDAPVADAADIARHAAASAARRDFEHALDGFNRACALAPDDASYFYQRAIVEFELHMPKPAADDLDRALTLRPEYLDALLARADYRRLNRDEAGALADLDKADRAAMREDDMRLRLAGFYGSLYRPEQVITQTDLWLTVHEQDARAPAAYNERCWARGLLDRDLDQALRDCNAGLRRSPPYAAQLLDSRGLVYLRRREFNKAIADYDAVLKTNPKMAWSLYGRGIAELRNGSTEKGQADIAAAKVLAPQLPDRAQQFGIVP